MPMLRINGAELYYEDVGSGPQTVFFSHGLLFSTRLFDPQVAVLKQRFRCISYDHRGQGQSGLSDGGYDMDSLALDAMALIEHFQVAPVHFVGLSMGGFVGMRVAARRADLVKTLTLLDTSAGPEPSWNVPRYKVLNTAAQWVGLRRLTRPVMKILFGKTFLMDPARAQERQQWREFLGARNPQGLARALGGVIQRKPVLDELKNIRCPTQVMVGEEDVATVPARSQEIHEAIPGSSLIHIPRAGHSAPLEEPAFVTAALERFLNGTEESANSPRTG